MRQRILSSLLVVVAVAVGCGGSSTAPPKTSGPTGPVASGSGGPGTPPPANPLEGWEKIRDEDGIVVYRKEVEGSPVVAFRGEGDVDAPIARIALAQMDITNAKEWVDKMVSARVLEVKNEKEYFTYSHIGAPPLVSDRDFVNHVNIDFAPPSKITFHLQGEDHPLAPPTAGVRGQLIHSSFDLTAITPEKTRLVVEIHADPKGSLPKWVVNQFQKAWAFKTISGLRKQVKKNGIVDRAADIKGVITRQGFPNF